MTRYWLGVALKDHVQIGVEGGFLPALPWQESAACAHAAW